MENLKFVREKTYTVNIEFSIYIGDDINGVRIIMDDDQWDYGDCVDETIPKEGIERFINFLEKYLAGTLEEGVTLFLDCHDSGEHTIEVSKDEEENLLIYVDDFYENGDIIYVTLNAEKSCRLKIFLLKAMSALDAARIKEAV